MKTRSKLNYQVLRILKNLLLRAAKFLTSIQRAEPAALMGYYHTIYSITRKQDSVQWNTGYQNKVSWQNVLKLINSLQRTSTMQKLFRNTFKLLYLFCWYMQIKICSLSAGFMHRKFCNCLITIIPETRNCYC